MQGQGGDRWGALCRSRGAGTRGGLWGGQGSALSEGQGPGPADRVAAGRRGHRGDGLERGLDALRLGSVRWAAGCRVRLSWVPAMEMLWKSRGAGRDRIPSFKCFIPKQTFCLWEPSCYSIPSPARPTPDSISPHLPSPKVGENSAQVTQHSCAVAGLLGSEMVQTEAAGTPQAWVIKPQGGGLC